jgi:hypothetical protein
MLFVQEKLAQQQAKKAEKKKKRLEALAAAGTSTHKIVLRLFRIHLCKLCPFFFAESFGEDGAAVTEAVAMPDSDDEGAGARALRRAAGEGSSSSSSSSTNKVYGFGGASSTAVAKGNDKLKTSFDSDED